MMEKLTVPQMLERLPKASPEEMRLWITRLEFLKQQTEQTDKPTAAVFAETIRTIEAQLMLVTGAAEPSDEPMALPWPLMVPPPPRSAQKADYVVQDGKVVQNANQATAVQEQAQDAIQEPVAEAITSKPEPVNWVTTDTVQAERDPNESKPVKRGRPRKNA